MLSTARHRGLHTGKASDVPYMVDERWCRGTHGMSWKQAPSWRLAPTGEKEREKKTALQGKLCGIHRAAEGSQGRLQGQGAESGGLAEAGAK